jgi:hypothetical protein
VGATPWRFESSSPHHAYPITSITSVLCLLAAGLLLRTIVYSFACRAIPAPVRVKWGTGDPRPTSSPCYTAICNRARQLAARTLGEGSSDRFRLSAFRGTRSSPVRRGCLLGALRDSRQTISDTGVISSKRHITGTSSPRRVSLSLGRPNVRKLPTGNPQRRLPIMRRSIRNRLIKSR